MKENSTVSAMKVPKFTKKVMVVNQSAVEARKVVSAPASTLVPIVRAANSTRSRRSRTGAVLYL